MNVWSLEIEVFMYILKNVYEVKRDGNVNMIGCIGVIMLFVLYGI